MTTSGPPPSFSSPSVPGLSCAIPTSSAKATSGWTLNAEGVPSIAMGVASRYIHSHVSIIDRRDFDSTVKLLVALVKRLDRKTVDALS